MEEQQPKVWESVDPGVWKPEKEEDSIEGTLLSKKENVGINESNAYYIETKDGTFMVWGSTVLDDRMSLIPEGEKVRITYKGIQKNSRGQDVKIFKVEKQKDFSPKIDEEKVE